MRTPLEIVKHRASWSQILDDVETGKLQKPRVRLVGEDGNALAIVGRTVKALRRKGWNNDQITTYQAEALSGSYDKVIYITMQLIEECGVEAPEADHF